MAAALLTTLTACGGEVVHPRIAAGSVAPSDLAAPGQCVTSVDVFDTGQLLRPSQIMAGPADQGAGQQSWMYVISPRNCAGAGYPMPQCDGGFPWAGVATGDGDAGSALGPIGVTSLVTSIVRYDVPAASVTETVLGLSGDAGSILANFAGVCMYPQINGNVYAADLGEDLFDVVQINDDVAVGLEFDGTGLSATERLRILAAAVAQVPLS